MSVLQILQGVHPGEKMTMLQILQGVHPEKWNASNTSGTASLKQIMFQMPHGLHHRKKYGNAFSDL